jgi:hypothetical protein
MGCFDLKGFGVSVKRKRQKVSFVCLEMILKEFSYIAQSIASFGEGPFFPVDGGPSPT